MSSSHATDKTSITVCVCTYNRSQKLARLLTNILDDLRTPGDCHVDFLFIDNCSSDDTAELIKSFQPKFLEKAKQLSRPDLKLSYYYEESQGLSHARNRALQEAQSDWLLFTDDDVQLDSHWLVNYFRMTQEYPQAEFFGGRVLLHWEQAKPTWLLDEDMPLLSGVLCKNDNGSEHFAYEFTSALPYGASFAIARSLIQKIDPFRVDLGVSGDEQGRGEDTEYFTRALTNGARGYYCADAICYHDAVIERLTTRYLFSHGVAKGKAEFLFGNTRVAGKWRQCEIAVRACWQLIKGRRDLYFQGIINLGMAIGVNASHKSKVLVSK